ncbi:MAG: type II secretion system protein [Sedimentisphaerales bacterium]|nr:type II secretion system protein [Sedimentisphaerales bacterium]
MHDYISDGNDSRREGFTLMELLVVIFIISVLMSILVPVVGKARRHAKALLNMNNQRQIVDTLNCYAFDHDDRYPESVATLGTGRYWNWQEPTMLTGYLKRSPRLHRSVGRYLGGYIGDAAVVTCPSAPKQYSYINEAWEAGDDWDNPDTGPVPDPVIGTYCFYWNYVGYLGEEEGLFIGPRGPAGGREQSDLVVSDYFGYDHWRSPRRFGSCERLPGGEITEGTDVSSSYWSLDKRDANDALKNLRITLHAGYLDGHVGKYHPSDVVPMQVSLSPDGRTPYPAGVGPGVFYLPQAALLQW